MLYLSGQKRGMSKLKCIWPVILTGKCPKIISSPLSHIDMTFPINLFQKMGVVQLCLGISSSVLAMKMLAKTTAILVPMAVPCACNLYR